MRIRDEVIIGTCIGIIAVAVSVQSGLSYTKSLQLAPPTSAPTGTSPQETGVPSGQTQTVSLAPNDVAKHTTESDCWIIIDGSVFNVTKYLSLHPGGAFRILPYCGKDASTAFATKGGNGVHSAVAHQLLNMLKIGSLGGTTNASTVTAVDQSVTSQPVFRTKGEGDDD